jgi:hypothetical protein
MGAPPSSPLPSAAVGACYSNGRLTRPESARASHTLFDTERRPPPPRPLSRARGPREVFHRIPKRNR